MGATVDGLVDDSERSGVVHASPEELAVEFEQDGLEIRSGVWGDFHVALYTLPPETDLTPFFNEFPGGLCPCNHWGQMLNGQVHLRYADGTEEVTLAGEVFHWRQEHTAWTGGGATFLAYTPMDEVRRMDAQAEPGSQQP